MICELWIEAYINWAYLVMAEEFQLWNHSKLLLSSFDCSSDEGSDHVPLCTALSAHNSPTDAENFSQNPLPHPVQIDVGSSLAADSSPVDEDLSQNPQPHRAQNEYTLESLSVAPREMPMFWGPVPVESLEILDDLLQFSPEVDVDGFFPDDEGRDNDEPEKLDAEDQDRREDSEDCYSDNVACNKNLVEGVDIFAEQAKVELAKISSKINYAYLKMILVMTTCKDQLGYFDQPQLDSMVSKIIDLCDHLQVIEWQSRGEIVEPSVKYSTVLQMGAKVFQMHQAPNWQLPIKYKM